MQRRKIQDRTRYGHGQADNLNIPMGTIIIDRSAAGQANPCSAASGQSAAAGRLQLHYSLDFADCTGSKSSVTGYGCPARGVGENGAKPLRTRRCDRGRKPPACHCPMGWEGLASRVIREPEDLPVAKGRACSRGLEREADKPRMKTVSRTSKLWSGFFLRNRCAAQSQAKAVDSLVEGARDWGKRHGQW